MKKLICVMSLLAGLPGGENTAQAQQRPTGKTVIANSGNGIGNTIVVDGSGGPVQVINSRNGIGNSLLVRNGKTIDLNRLSYPGKGERFWTKREWDADLKAYLYWCPKTELWFRYDKAADVYRPSVEALTRDVDRAIKDAEREIDEAMKDLERELSGLRKK